MNEFIHDPANLFVLLLFFFIFFEKGNIDYAQRNR